MAGKRTVLVVDDEAAVREVVVRILSKRGYQVLEAEDETSALEAARSVGGVLHLLLADVVLKEGSGPDLVLALKKQWPELPVIYMSGYDEDELVAKGIRTVGSAYITKPFTADVLNLIVDGVLGVDVDPGPST